MPTYLHICADENCQNEWEDYYSIAKDPPTTCPKCQQETAKRVISGGNGRGIVELTGQELTDSIKQDAQRIKKEASQKENTYANLLGESKFEKLQRNYDKNRR